MRVAIVNDLALAREVLRRLVLSVSGYTVAWTAADGAEAVDRAAPRSSRRHSHGPGHAGHGRSRGHAPDHGRQPVSILLVTSSVSGNFNKVYEAMGHGGLDAVNTPTLGPDGQVRDSEGLLARLARLGRSRQGSPCRRWACQLRVPAGPTVRLQSLPWWRWVPPRGEPEALAQVLGVFPPNLPAAVVVVQHIGPEFIPSLAQWLPGRTRLPVRLAAEGDVLIPGEVRLAAGRSPGRLWRPPAGLHGRTKGLRLSPLRGLSFRQPGGLLANHGRGHSVDGHGNGGAKGLAVAQAGWLTLAQDQATSVVYGMPQAAVECGAACRVLPLAEIAPAILSGLVNRLGR